MNDEIRTRIVALVEQIAEQPLGDVTHQDDLLVSGYLDSFGFVQLLLQLNSEFGIEVTEEMQLDPRLRTVDGLTEIVEHA